MQETCWCFSATVRGTILWDTVGTRYGLAERLRRAYREKYGHFGYEAWTDFGLEMGQRTWVLKLF